MQRAAMLMALAAVVCITMVPVQPVDALYCNCDCYYSSYDRSVYASSCGQCSSKCYDVCYGYGGTYTCTGANLNGLYYFAGAALICVIFTFWIQKRLIARGQPPTNMQLGFHCMACFCCPFYICVYLYCIEPRSQPLQNTATHVIPNGTAAMPSSPQPAPVYNQQQQAAYAQAVGGPSWAPAPQTGLGYSQQSYATVAQPYNAAGVQTAPVHVAAPVVYAQPQGGVVYGGAPVQPYPGQPGVVYGGAPVQPYGGQPPQQGGVYYAQ